MIYDVIIIDVFNILYRVNKQGYDVIDLCNAFIDNYNICIKRHLHNEGFTWFLFDPIPKSDMGMQKYFHYVSDRQKILPDYKANRTFEPIIKEAAKFIRNYYLYRGKQIKTVISSFLEADDFVEKILELYPHKKVALLSNDLDWSKYITNDNDLINKSFDSPLTKDLFIEKWGYPPTPASVTLQKALFGDSSDNIKGALNSKVNKDLSNVRELCQKWVREVGETTHPITEIVRRLKSYTFIELQKKDVKTTEELCWIELTDVTLKVNLLSALLDNIRVIKSRCKDLSKYIGCNPVNNKMNALFERTLDKYDDVQEELF